MPELVLSPEADPQPTSDASALLSHTFRTFRTFRTLPNIFKLSRQYYSDRLPTHDPEEVTTLENLTLRNSDQDVNLPTPVKQYDDLEAADAFYPYPNKSSFLLGDWFWNGGVQKSQKSFMELLQIIGDPEFQPEDIRATRWNFINRQLGSTMEDAEGHTPFEGAGWKTNPVKIKVPVHNRADGSGIHDYFTAEFHH